MTELRRTPLFEAHEQLGGKIIDFGGWALPVQYTGILDEHRAVRVRAGLFDVSHMGEIMFEGPQAFAAIQHLLVNDCSGMEMHQVLYSPMCYPDGGVVDDLIVYKLGDQRFLLVVNASNTGKDFDWMSKNIVGFDVSAVNISADMAQIAIQGPAAQDILQRNTATDLSALRFFYCAPDTNVAGRKCLVSRTGYTGEDGFEIYCAPADARHIWDTLLASGADSGLIPAGLGARDTLRFEAALPLYGHELSAEISPLEAGLGFFVKLGKDEFIGKDALVAQKTHGLARKLAGIELVDRGVPRQGYTVLSGGAPIGHVTSGVFSPTLQKGLALALIPPEYAKAGTELALDIRGKACAARVVKIPFYKKAYRKE